MKTLFLLRHAKSSWKDDTLADFERPLNRRGKHAAETIGHYFKTSAIVPELILCSPAERTRQTVELLLKHARWSTEVRYDQRIYEASAQRLVEVVSQIDNDRKVAMLVGHNPGLEDLLLLFTGNTEVMPTGAIAKLMLKTTKWATALEKRATLDWIVRPKDLEE
ncbi:MAG TPA: histidine phosphatase family protein [Pyrinomonadaceae bacterium]